MAKAEQELGKLRSGIPRYYKTEERVRQKAATILESRHVRDLYQLEVGVRDDMPFIHWARDEEAIERAQRISGCHPLLTNLPAEYSADEVLRIQKDQYRVEHRFANWKGPLAVCPMFLKTNAHIAALVAITALSLTVLSLIERQVRSELGDEQGYAVGFCPEKRKSRPTGGKILHALRNIVAIVATGEPRIVHVANVTPLVRQVHDALGASVDRLIQN